MLKAIYLDKKSLAEDNAGRLGVDAYYRTPEADEHSHASLLKRQDVHAFAMITSPSTQPDMIAQILRAGKHVLSEKPIAKDLDTAHKLLQRYRSLTNGGSKAMWSVGESFRFRETVLFAKYQLRHLNGSIKSFRMQRAMANETSNSTSMSVQQAEEFRSRYLLEFGVELIAALRLLITPFNVTITKVTASPSLLSASTPSTSDESGGDAPTATLWLSNGKTGTFGLTTPLPNASSFEIRVHTTKCAVTLRDHIVLVREKKSQTQDESEHDSNSNDNDDDYDDDDDDDDDDEDGGSTHAESNEKVRLFPPPSTSVKREIEVFGGGINKGELEKRGTPEEAYEDLKVMQRILESAREGGVVKEAL